MTDEPTARLRWVVAQHRFWRGDITLGELERIEDELATALGRPQWTRGAVHAA